MLRKAGLLLLIAVLFLVPKTVHAQFGQNKVVYENKGVLFYQSEYADFYHWQDIEDENQIKYLAHVVDQVERSYGFLSGYLSHTLSKRPNVVFYRTHSTFAATHILGEHFIPEGVLAFALPTGYLLEEYVLAIKLDLSVQEYDATITHEMAHIFQFDMGPNIFKRLLGDGPPNWIMEGGAEFLGNEYNGSRTDDLREDVRRGAGANPEKDLPTWLDLNQGRADPYTFGPMTFEFIRIKYGEEVMKKFLIRSFKDGEDLIDVLAELTKGAVRSSEQFDEAQRDYWREKLGLEMLAKPRPYQENDNFRGRHVVPEEHPEPVISPVISPDGKKIAVITASPKYGIVLAVIPALPREVPEYKPELEPANSSTTQKSEKGWKIQILTPFLPPKHYEYIALELTLSNLSWAWAGGKEYVSFFAQNGKDHTLFLVDPNDRKNLTSILVPLDNALSPELSPTGTKVYFSASWKNTRDIYEIDLATRTIKNLTNDDSFDESPAVSPDGTKIAYVSFWNYYRKIFILDLVTGDKKQLTFNSFNDRSPSWSDDGTLIAYVSDEKDGVSSLYTIDLASNLVSQQTDFFGTIFSVDFARGENDRLYYTHLWQYDQYRNFIGQNFELFDILLKKPYRQYVMEDKSEEGNLVFRPERDLFKFKLDSNQLLNPTKPPEKWSCGGGSVSVGVNTYWGMFGQSHFGCSNILQTKQHLGLFASYGSFRLIDYSYANQEKRTGWRLGGHQYQLPLYYQFYDIVHRYPRQYLLNNTWMNESSLDFAGQYPLDTSNRWEFFSKLRHRSFNVSGFDMADLDRKVCDDLAEPFTEQDVQMCRFLKTSDGSNFVFGTAYVRDTVLHSVNTGLSGVPAPFHGNAVKIGFEGAPRLGEEFQGYVSVNLSARTYHHLGSSSLFAGRGEFTATSRANGDFILLCGPDRLRGCEYGSSLGNQVAYGSVELRFPVPGTYILYQNVRAFLFADGVLTKFSGEVLPAQKLGAYGFGVQYVIPFIGLPGEHVFRRENGKWKPSFYITYSF